jgi:hypothetical protein
MKDTMPTWPQTLFICAIAAAFIVLGYFLSRMRGNWGPPAWAMLAFLLICGLGFIASVILFYLRPQYGAKALPFFVAFMLGHVVVVALLWRIGVFGR